MASFRHLSDSAIENLRALSRDSGDNTFIREVVRMFVHQTPRKIDEIVAAAAEGEPVAIARSAHSLKSSAYQIGAEALGNLCLRLERGEEAASLVRELRAEWVGVRAELLDLPELREGR